ALSEGGGAQFRRQSGSADGDRRAGGVLADAGHLGGFQALQRKSESSLRRPTMKAILTVQNFTSDFVTSFWTPTFVGIFVAIVIYALWPRNQAAFDDASKMPLRED